MLQNVKNVDKICKNVEKISENVEKCWVLKIFAKNVEMLKNVGLNIKIFWC